MLHSNQKRLHVLSNIFFNVFLFVYRKIFFASFVQNSLEKEKIRETQNKKVIFIRLLLPDVCMISVVHTINASIALDGQKKKL